jgi:hypothetical protein
LLVWLGVLAYVGYTYLHTFAIAWNRPLVYVALLSLTVFTIVRACPPGACCGLSGRRSPPEVTIAPAPRP